MLKLKLQYFGHLMQTVDSLKSPWCWERLRAEGEEGMRRWNGWMASLMQWTWTWANFGGWWETDGPGVLGVTKSQTWLMSKPPLLLPQPQYPSIDLMFCGLVFSYLLWCHMPWERNKSVYQPMGIRATPQVCQLEDTAGTLAVCGH